MLSVIPPLRNQRPFVSNMTKAELTGTSRNNQKVILLGIQDVCVNSQMPTHPFPGSGHGKRGWAGLALSQVLSRLGSAFSPAHYSEQQPHTRLQSQNEAHLSIRVCLVGWFYVLLTLDLSLGATVLDMEWSRQWQFFSTSCLGLHVPAFPRGSFLLIRLGPNT